MHSIKSKTKKLSKSKSKRLSKSKTKRLSKSKTKRLIFPRGKSIFSKKKLSKTIKRRMTVKKCNNLLKDKIKINMIELKQGKYKSRGQAIAVSYSQIKKENPKCKKYFDKK
jgi:hypothetical protein